MPIKNLREDRRPADLWFWNDWLASIDVRSCSLAAQGLWINMLAAMSRSDRKGYLSINGKPMDSKELAKFVGCFKDEVERLLIELEYYNVFSRDTDGTIYSRRMAREADLSRKRAEAGQKGGFAKQDASKNLANSSSKGVATLDIDNEDEDESDSLTIKKIEVAWNDFAHKHDISWINGIAKGSARERALLTRLHEPTWNFDKLLEAIAAQPFLTGDNPRGWLVSFDWLLKPANLQKVMEGAYVKKVRGDRVGENK